MNWSPDWRCCIYVIVKSNQRCNNDRFISLVLRSKRYEQRWHDFLLLYSPGCLLLSFLLLSFLCSFVFIIFWSCLMINCYSFIAVLYWLSFIGCLVRIFIGYKRPPTWWNASKDLMWPLKPQGWNHICGVRVRWYGHWLKCYKKVNTPVKHRNTIYMHVCLLLLSIIWFNHTCVLSFWLI